MGHNDTLILLITIDSLRRDYVGCFGNRGANSPFMDKLASEGTRFDNALSNGASTAESFPTIMCSGPPPIRLEDRGVKGKRKIAQLLKECGFATAAFHSNPFLSAGFGYQEGFDTFYAGAKDRLPALIEGVKLPLNQFFLNKGPITDCWELIRRAIRWSKSAAKPAFLWVHFMDTHLPYLPEVRVTGLINSMRNRTLWGILLTRNLQDKLTRPSSELREQMTNAYGACIRKVDRSIGLLASEIFKQFSNRLIILASDHGEGFWEHGYFGHSGRMHDEILRVPLIVYGNGIASARTVKGMVALSDIMPTVARYVGQSSDSEYGHDLLATVADPDLAERRVISTGFNPRFKLRSVSIRTPISKYVRQEIIDGSRILSEQFYDLVKDPNERIDVHVEHPGEAALAEQELERVYGSDYGRRGVYSVGEEKHMTDRLRSLGYE